MTPLKLWYVHDRKQPLLLPNDIDGAIAALRKEFDAGHADGILETRSVRVEPLQAQGREQWFWFEKAARKWLAAVLASEGPDESFDAWWPTVLEQRGLEWARGGQEGLARWVWKQAKSS